MSQLFTSVGQSIRASASASVLPVNIQIWLVLGLTGLVSLLSSVIILIYIWKKRVKQNAYISKSKGKKLNGAQGKWKKEKVRKISNSFYKASITLLIKKKKQKKNKKKLTSTLEKKKILNWHPQVK